MDELREILCFNKIDTTYSMHYKMATTSSLYLMLCDAMKCITKTQVPH